MASQVLSALAQGEQRRGGLLSSPIETSLACGHVVGRNLGSGPVGLPLGMVTSRSATPPPAPRLPSHAARAPQKQGSPHPSTDGDRGWRGAGSCPRSRGESKAGQGPGPHPARLEKSAGRQREGRDAAEEIWTWHLRKPLSRPPKGRGSLRPLGQEPSPTSHSTALRICWMCCTPEILFPGTQPSSSVSTAAGPMLRFQARQSQGLASGAGPPWVMA